MSATTSPAAEGKSLTPRERRKRRRDPELSSQSSLKDVLTVVHSTQPEESVKDPCVVQADQGPTSEIKEAEKDTLKQSEPIDESNAVSHPQSSVPDLMESTRQSQSQDCTVESPGSSEDEFFTPPSSPNYLDEPLHCWAEDLIERYYKSPRTWKPKPPPNRDANGRTEAERLFALLEERFYSDMTREQEMELFFGTKRTPKRNRTPVLQVSSLKRLLTAPCDARRGPVKANEHPASAASLASSQFDSNGLLESARILFSVQIISCRLYESRCKGREFPTSRQRFCQSYSTKRRSRKCHYRSRTNARTNTVNLVAAAAAATPLMSGGNNENVSPWTNPCLWFRNWLCSNPMDNCTLVGIILGGIVCLLIAVMSGPVYIIPILGGIVVFGAANRVWALRSLAAEIDRFSAENEKLEETEKRLLGEVKFLTKKKDDLTGHVNKLEVTVTELNGVSEGLHNELEQFKHLEDNIKKFAAETGADVKNILGEANKIHEKMERMTNQNERALLGKIAQDIEFLDKDAGMGEEEFNNFFARIPENLQKRFHSIGLNFQKVAGDDGIVDFMEVEKLISTLMSETDEKISSLSGK
eukprot:g76.t1